MITRSTILGIYFESCRNSFIGCIKKLATPYQFLLNLEKNKDGHHAVCMDGAKILFETMKLELECVNLFHTIN